MKSYRYTEGPERHWMQSRTRMSCQFLAMAGLNAFFLAALVLEFFQFHILWHKCTTWQRSSDPGSGAVATKVWNVLTEVTSKT
jgi:hypothetical protein